MLSRAISNEDAEWECTLLKASSYSILVLTKTFFSTLGSSWDFSSLKFSLGKWGFFLVPILISKDFSCLTVCLGTLSELKSLKDSEADDKIELLSEGTRPEWLSEVARAIAFLIPGCTATELFCFFSYTAGFGVSVATCCTSSCCLGGSWGF